MGRRRRRNSALETPSTSGDIWTAMLLYEAPSGIAVFSFDENYLYCLAEDFWKSLPSLSLEVIITSKRVPTPIDFANKSVDSELADSLTELCGYEKTLVVGSAELKRIIETKLGITCLYVDVPDYEVIICHLKDHVCEMLGFSGDASAMLLYEAPFGITIFSFNGSYLNGLVKDFWACLPPFSLVEFMTCERVPTPIDLENEAIDDRLTKKLMKLCGSEKKLAVGNAEHKRLIEMKLEKITCVYVDIPDCEVIICSLEKPLGTLLLHEEKADPVKNIIPFLRQHYFDIPDGKVEQSYHVPAVHLHNVELCEKNYLKFFRLLLNNFMSRSGIDTKNWLLIQFATALKMICYPRAPYEVYHPDEMFSSDVYSSIVDHSPGYKGGFLKIGVLYVYNEVVSLYSQKCIHLHKLNALVMKAAKMKAKLEEHPSAEVPNGFCKEIYNTKSKLKKTAEQTGKLEADNSVLGSVMGELDATSTMFKDNESEAHVRYDNVRPSEDEVKSLDRHLAVETEIGNVGARGSVMGELDATSTLLKDKESEAYVRHDNVRPSEDEVTPRLVDVRINPAEKEAPVAIDAAAKQAADTIAEFEWLTYALDGQLPKVDRSIFLCDGILAWLKKQREGLLRVVNYLKAQVLEAEKPSEEAMPKTCQLNHTLVVSRLMEKEEKDGLLLGELLVAKEPMAKTHQFDHTRVVSRLMDKEEENGLLEIVNHLEVELMRAEEALGKTLEYYRTLMASSLMDKGEKDRLLLMLKEENMLVAKVNRLQALLLLAKWEVRPTAKSSDRHMTELQTGFGNVGLGYTIELNTQSSQPESSNAGLSSHKMSAIYLLLLSAATLCLSVV